MGATKEEAAVTRQRLLRTATHVIHTRGLSGFTLDLIAKEAGISKGGLLHHFPSKNALLEELLRSMINDFEERAQAHYDQEQPRPGRWLRAYVRATFDDSLEVAPLALEVMTLLFTAVTEQTGLQKIIQQDTQQWHERFMRDGVTAGRALLVRHAADAYWMDRLFAAPSYDPALRQAFIDELLQLTEVSSS